MCTTSDTLSSSILIQLLQVCETQFDFNKLMVAYLNQSILLQVIANLIFIVSESQAGDVIIPFFEQVSNIYNSAVPLVSPIQSTEIWKLVIDCLLVPMDLLASITIFLLF